MWFEPHEIVLQEAARKDYLSAPFPSFSLRSFLPQTYRIHILHLTVVSTQALPNHMASQHNFQAMPPIRTNTVGSLNSQSSGNMSPPTSPTSPASRASPTEQSFFGAISARVRGRSRSRSRDASRKRSKSPMMASPPRQITQPAQAQQPQRVSVAQPARPSLQMSDRRSTGGSDPWRGRHSNDWLFNGWSATDTMKDMVKRK
ncbi:hypothetical protein CC86DRAFT_373621 [Ophiobolus disseminans]|uniref:Uncharacterized protein n=1 Tax=Ophiobolus disseminans TaxID=1469910 RepID=A0A6A6ZL77_9PLEO|nr:hypothetical protein CC86DRAFT_373621 [Ophiobolus disseminans]